MKETFEIGVGETFLDFSDVVLDGGFTLYNHQAELIETDGDVILLDAPTGAGKTLAALKRVLDRNQSAIFIYPTNSLVRNQVTAMKSLLEENLGRSVNLIGPDSRISEVIKKINSTDVDLFQLTGDSLEVLSEKESLAKGSVLDRVLTGTHKSGRMRILLTNPDTLYLAFVNRYQRAGRISEQIDTFSVIVLDEFHLYSGPLLARIIFLVNYLRGSVEHPSMELVFLSATHGDMLELLKYTYPSLRIIQVQPLISMPEDGWQIRYSSKCYVKTIGNILTSEDDATNVADDILRFYDSALTETLPVKVLGIFSSVSFAIRVARKIRVRLSKRDMDPDTILFQLHGLVPTHARSHLGKMKNAILVGTSAIEVGIDFDVPYLVIEAHDIGSFLQRFGRGGRHRKCEGILYLPRVFADRLKAKRMWEFPEFVNEVHVALKELSSYAGFLCSNKVQSILLAMALAASRMPRTPFDKKERYDIDAALTTYTDLIEANKSVSIGQHSLWDVVFEKDTKRIRSQLMNYTIKTMVKYGFLRGTMNSVLVRYPGELIGLKGGEYGECDFFDLFKMKGRIETVKQHAASIPKRLQKRRTQDDPVFVIEDLVKPAYPNVLLTDNSPVRRRTSVYKEPDCHLKFKNRQLSDIGQQILHGRNLAFHWRSLSRHTDFRIPRIYAQDDAGGLVIGDWAFVSEYLLHKQLQEDKT